MDNSADSVFLGNVARNGDRRSVPSTIGDEEREEATWRGHGCSWARASAGPLFEQLSKRRKGKVMRSTTMVSRNGLQRTYNPESEQVISIEK